MKEPADGLPIQISVYPDKLMLWNPGELPLDWTVAKLKGKHPSQPFNPDAANTFFRAGMIESWGRGIERIMEACSIAGTAKPLLRYERTGIWIEFTFPTPSQDVVKDMSGKIPDLILMLLQTNGSLSIPSIAMQIGKTTRTVERAIQQLRTSGNLKRVGPDRNIWNLRIPSCHRYITKKGHAEVLNCFHREKPDVQFRFSSVGIYCGALYDPLKQSRRDDAMGIKRIRKGRNL